MADFRKLFVALIAGALLFGSVASAVDYGCSARAVPTTVRAESVDDFVGDVLLDCSGDIPLAVNPALGMTVNIKLQLNTTVTSRLLTAPSTPPPGPVTEGTLILDNALPAARGYAAVSGNLLTPMTDGSQNIYQAVRVSDTELEWQGVVLMGPNSNPISSIRLTNVRGRAAGVIPAGGIITGTVMITTPTSVTIGNNKMDLAYVRPGLVVTYPGVVTFNNCDFLGSGSFTAENSVVLTEGFGTAFKPRINTFDGANPAVPHNLPGGDYFDESGYNPLWGASSSGSLPSGSLAGGGVLQSGTSIGVATTGTQFAVIVTNIPAGVNVQGETGITTANGLHVDRVSSSMSGSTLTLIYEVMGYLGSGTAQFLGDVVTIGIEATVGPPTAIGTMQVHARFNPLAIGSTLVGVQDLSPSNDNNPRFLDITDPNPTVDLFAIGQNCKTLLLFPYLTGQLGYESGIAITNTSVDPITGARMTVAQAGACTLNFYGQQAAGKAPLTAAMATQTSVTIPAGGQLTLIASGGLASGTVYARDGSQVAACATSTSNPCTGIPAFQGYMIATCNFQYAHGFAFVTDTQSSRTQGYLALVIPYRVINDDGDIARPPVDSSFFALPNQGENLGN